MGFNEFSLLLRLLKFVEPEFKLPCRQTTMHRLLAKKDVLAASIKDDMSTRATEISITTDIWTSITNEAYMSFTASYLTPQWTNMNVVRDSVNIYERHTLEHISTKLGEIACVWNISEKIVQLQGSGRKFVDRHPLCGAFDQSRHHHCNGDEQTISQAVCEMRWSCEPSR